MSPRILLLISGSITSYLLDVQPGLHVVLSETQGANVTRHVHSIKGIHAHKDASNNWEWPLQDGLGSVREVVDNTVAVLESRNYDPFGTGFGNTGTSQTNYGFTGELVDGGLLLDLRARRYAPVLGVFASLDPFEGMADEPMSINGYSYVHGNPVNWTDPSGEFINVLAGAVVGAVVGAVGSAVMYGLATSGGCGEKMKCQMESMGLGNAVLSGAVFGAVAGALVGATGPLGAAVAGGIGAGFAGYDILKNGLNVCNALALGASIGGGLGGTVTLRVPTGFTFEPISFTPALQPVGGPSFGGGITIPIPTGITWSPPIAVPIGVPVVVPGVLFYDSGNQLHPDTQNKALVLPQFGGG